MNGREKAPREREDSAMSAREPVIAGTMRIAAAAVLAAMTFMIVPAHGADSDHDPWRAGKEAGDAQPDAVAWNEKRSGGIDWREAEREVGGSGATGFEPRAAERPDNRRGEGEGPATRPGLRRDGTRAPGAHGTARRCADAWDDCRDGLDRREPSARFGNPRSGPRWPDPRDGRDREAEGGPGETDPRRGYADALADLLGGEAGEPPPDDPSARDGDYGSALEELEERERAEARARERARDEARREAAREEERRKARIAAGKAAAREAEKRARDTSPSRGMPGGAAPGTAGGGCADGPICRRTAENAETVLRKVTEVTARARLDITNSSLAMAFTTRASIACIEACLEREERRAACRNGLRGAIGELTATYDSAIRNARAASADDGYVDRFVASPQTSAFARRHFSHIRGNIDTCGF